MNFFWVCFAVHVLVRVQGSRAQVVQAGFTSECTSQTPLPSNATRELNEIPHDQVKPFHQPEPVTISEKVGVKFKPQIQIRTGCEPYPAVNEFGDTNGGLKPTGDIRGKCGGSDLGSQVYGRTTWHKDVYAIMYAWYFPKDATSHDLGNRHAWEDAVIFIDNPDVPEPKVLGCSVSSNYPSGGKGGYKKYNPCPWYGFDGTSLKVRYKRKWPDTHDLDVTGDKGKFQDLIMWDQLTEKARAALQEGVPSTMFKRVPISDPYFALRIERAYPF